MKVFLYSHPYLNAKQYRVLDEQFDTYREAFLFACGVAQGIDLANGEDSGTTICEITLTADDDFVGHLKTEGSKL